MDENINPEQDSNQQENQSEVQLNQPVEQAAQQQEQHVETGLGEQQATAAAEVSNISADSRNMAVLCHLLGAFTLFVGALVIWLIKKDTDEYVDRQGKEALNFQITIALGYLVCGALMIAVLGFFLVPLLYIFNVIFCVIASVAVSKGKDYKYPLSLRLIN